MLKSELIKDNRFVKYYSDIGKMIKQKETDILYVNAIDTYPSNYTYEETNEDIPQEDATMEEYAQAGKILLGEEQ